MSRIRPYFFLLFALIAGPNALAQMSAPPQVSPVELRFKRGDDPRWAARDFDDSDWGRIGAQDFPTRAGIHWVRFRLQRPTGFVAKPEGYSYVWPSDSPGAPIDAIYIGSVYSFELYWDGRLLARGGTVGATRETEKVGPLNHLIRIPDELLGPEEHVVAFRISSFHYNFPATKAAQGFMLDNYALQVASEASRPVLPLLGAGACVLISFFGFGLYFWLERRRTLLLCGMLGLLLAGFYGLIALRWLYNTPYDWHYPRLLAITLLMGATSGLLPWLLMEQFDGPRRRWLAALIPLLLLSWLTSPIYEVKALWICRSMLLVMLGITAWAVWHRRPGAWFVLGGVLLGLLLVRADRRAFLDPSFFLVVGGLALFVFAAVGNRLRGDREQAQRARLTAARLEVELLKKNLQPHFLLNTLTAVSEIIEQDPAGAVKFIEDLATEFRSLALMSGERLVPLQRELDLCCAHLKVISRRTGRKIALQVEGVETATLVPPALFLTLIENGLVHQQAEDGAAFRLSARQSTGGVAFSFQSPGRTRDQAGRLEGGTGLRYVRARLEESFPGRWMFSQGPGVAGWETIIEWHTTIIPGRQV